MSPSTLLRALCLSVPPLLRAHHRGEVSHCLDAVMAVKYILSRHRVVSRPVSCAVTAWRTGDAPCVVGWGHDEASFARWCAWRGMAQERARELYRRQTMREDVPGVVTTRDAFEPHVVLEVEHAGRLAWVDLTAEQAEDRTHGLVRLSRPVVSPSGLNREACWPLSVPGTDDGSSVDYVLRPWRGPGRAPWKGHRVSDALVRDVDAAVAILLGEVSFDATREAMGLLECGEDQAARALDEIFYGPDIFT